MKQKIVNIVALLVLGLTPMGALSGTVYAACGDTDTPAGQVNQGFGQTGSDCNDNGVSNAFEVIVKIISLIAGAIAIIMIITSGLKYMTSGGDSGKVAAAKSALIYALIGVAVAASAQILVHFTVRTATRCSIPGKETLSATDVGCVH